MYKPSTYQEITYFLTIYLYMKIISYIIGYQGQRANAINQKQNVINPPTQGLHVGDKRTWACSTASFMMDAKAFHMALWDIIHSPP
jgi:hypothetical protein